MRGVIIPYYPWPVVSPPTGYHWWNDQPVPYTPNPMPNADTAAIIAAAQAYPNVPVYVAVNGGSDGFWRHGPGSQYDDAFNTAVNQLRAAGVKVLGYVYTWSGTNSDGFADYNLVRTLPQAEADVDNWLAMYPQIDGFFWDEYSANPGGVPFYQQLCQYARTKKSGCFIVGNNAVSDAWYSFAGAPDVVFAYESPGLPSISTLASAGGTPAQRGIIPYNVTPAQVTDAVIQNYLAVVDYVYFEDAGNNVGGYTLPWQYVSTFLARQMSVISATNPAATTTASPTTGAPTTAGPTTAQPTTGVPTTGVPTTGAPTTAAPLAPPAGLSVSNNPAQITAMWGAVPGATQYALVYRYWNQPDGSEAEGFRTYDGKLLIDGDDTVVTIASGLPTGNSLNWKVAAIKDGVYSAYSASVAATPAAVTIPPPVISAVAGNGQATVSLISMGRYSGSNWTLAYGPNLEYQWGGSGNSPLAVGVLGAVVGLTNGIPCKFALRVFNPDWTASELSNVVTVTPSVSTTPVPTTSAPTTTTPPNAAPSSNVVMRILPDPTTTSPPTTLPPKIAIAIATPSGIVHLQEVINGGCRIYEGGSVARLGFSDEVGRIRIVTPQGVKTLI